MHKNYLWQGFLAVVFLTTLWYTGVAVYRYQFYSHLSAETPVTAMKWDIQELSDEDFIVESAYRFLVNNQIYQGITTWSKQPYRNHYSAEKAIEELSQQHWNAWYDPTDPQYSSLQKNFPLKECLSAVFLWGLLIYFLWIGFYVAKFKT